MTIAPPIGLTPQLLTAWARVQAYVAAMHPDDGGFTAEEVHVPRTQLTALEERFYLQPSAYRSKSHWGFSVADHPGHLPEWAEAAEAYERQAERDESAAIPGDIFDHIVGHDDLKALVLDTLHNMKPVHFGLFGPPAGAKSLFIEAINNAVTDVFRAYGGNVTRAGINEGLNGRNPRAITIDEADKLSRHDWDSLNEIMERHTLTVINGNGHWVQPMRAQVFIAANDASHVRPDIRSRLAPFYFKAYGRAEFVHVAEVLLRREFELDADLAYAVARWSWHEGITDVRQVRNVAWFMHGDTDEERFASAKAYLAMPSRMRDADFERMQQQGRPGQ